MLLFNFMAQHNDTGKAGEEQAQEYLRSEGYIIRHVNWRVGKLELDIVAQKGNILVVVEVKTRTTDIFEYPEEAVTPRKIRNLVNAAHEYIVQYDWKGETRFDVISVVYTGESYRIDHIQDAFLPPVR